MVQITLDNIVPATPPADGWIVEYRIKDTLGAFLVATGSPFSSFPIVFSTTDPAGTLYEGRITADCGDLESESFDWETPCDCTGVGYVSTGSECRKTDSVSAIISHSGYCLAPSVNAAYCTYGSRIYNPGFGTGTIMLAPGTSNPQIYGEMSAAPQWANAAPNTTDGPLNREGVWVDSDCDGNKDPLRITVGPLIVGARYGISTYGAGDDFTNVGAASNAAGVVFFATGTTPANWTHGSSLNGVQTTIAFMYNNTGPTKTVFLGVAADNQFKVVVNGVQIADTAYASDVIQFKFWHLLPVTMVNGVNNFNVIATGDGSVNDAVAMVIYNNTAAQLAAATSDASLTILFKSGSLRGTTYDTATCPAGYSLDVSGGAGSYICRRTLVKTCNSAV